MLRLEHESGKWVRFLFVFNIIWLFNEATLIHCVRNVSLLMDWCYWLRKIGVRSPSLSVMAVMPILCGVGYMLEKSFTTQIIVCIISALVVGDHYSLKLMPFLQILDRYQANTKPGT